MRSKKPPEDSRLSAGPHEVQTHQLSFQSAGKPGASGPASCGGAGGFRRHLYADFLRPKARRVEDETCEELKKLGFI